MLKRILITLLCTALISSTFTPFASASRSLVSVSFDDYETNAVPTELGLSSRGSHVSEYIADDKGLKLYAGKNGSSLAFDTSIDESYCITFDIMRGDEPVYGTLVAQNTSGAEQTLLDFKRSGDVNVWDGKRVGGFGKNLNRYTVCYNPVEKYVDVYVNDKAKLSHYRIKSPKVAQTSTIKLMLLSENGTGYVVLDNINIYTGTTPQKTLPRAPFNTEVLDEVELTTGAIVGDKVLVNETFESGNSLVAAAQANTLDVITDADGNKCMLFERKNETDFHLSASNLRSSSDCIVYEFNLKILDDMSDMRILMKDSASKFDLIGELGPGREFAFNNGFKKTLKRDTWYRISVIANYFDRTWTYYLDGKESGPSTTINEVFAMNGATCDIFRIHASNVNSLTARASSTDPLKFLVDDMRVYEGDALLDDLNAIQKTIDLTDKRSVFTSDKGERALLADYKAIHARSGVVIVGGNKTLLASRPFKMNDTFYVPVDEVASALGVSSATVEDAITTIDGTIFAPVEKTLLKLCGSYKYVPSATNSGLYIVGNSFVAPTDANAIQRLNDYAFYLRPTTQQVHDYYEASPQKGVHPRIQATKSDFDRIRAEVKTNDYKRTWAMTITNQADQILNQDPVTYDVIGGRLLYTSRKVLSRMYALGMAYQLTGDTKYSERAFVEMQTVSEFSDWHPSHHLDPCEMGAAVAIGYDWMYDAFTAEQRTIIEQGMYNNLFYDAWLGFLSTQYAMTNGSCATNNHNNVCNGGILVGALSMLDVYPDVCEYLISNATRGIDMVMFNFAPSGAWFEGPHYWEYTMQYTAKFIATMQSVMNTDMGMLSCEGLSTSADFIIYMQSPLSIFNYADGVYETIYSPEMLWLSNSYDNAGVTQAFLGFTRGKIKDVEDAALALVWYDTSISAGKVDLTLDKFYPDQGTITMRNSWDEADPTFVGFHAGETNVPHAQLDGGSFIFDAYGVRWAKDLGMGDYNSEGYWDNSANGQRWMHYRSRAEAHNTIIVNPGDKPDHNVLSNAPMTIQADKPRGVIATVDMTELLASDVTTAKRGAYFTDNRSSLVIRDELELKSSSTIHWSMLTDASGVIDGNRITLTQNGQKLYVDFVTNGKAGVSFGKAEALPTTVLLEPSNETANRLDITVEGSGSLNITVKLTPASVNGTSVTDYDMPIDGWTVPDGEIPPSPTLDSCTINGKPYSFNGGKTLSYSYLEGTLNGVPTISVADERYDVEVIYAPTLAEASSIIVYDKADRTNYTTYLVSFVELKLPMTFAGKTSIPIIAISASETPQEEHPASHVLDGDFNTRWSAEGAGQWLLLELLETTDIDSVGIAFFSGDKRGTFVSISTSSDGVNFTQVYSGKSCGTTNDIEFFPARASGVRYLKINFDGNDSGSAESWNSPTEVVVVK